jgi:CRISPR-associated protein Cmr5
MVEPIATRNQQYAQRAYASVAELARDSETSRDKFPSFAKSFPALVHGCGLAQALAFARGKKQTAYLEVLARTLGEVSSTDALLERSRSASLSDYIRLSRNVLEAAGWVKRFSEALLDDAVEAEAEGDVS